jgi:hypothetical protein
MVPLVLPGSSAGGRFSVAAAAGAVSALPESAVVPGGPLSRLTSQQLLEAYTPAYASVVDRFPGVQGRELFDVAAPILAEGGVATV